MHMSLVEAAQAVYLSRYVLLLVLCGSACDLRSFCRPSTRCPG